MAEFKLDLTIFREAVVEFSGTFIFMVFTLGSNAQTLLGRGSHGGFFEAKFANGLGVIMGVCVAGGSSGAHLNPAVTLAFACSRLFPWKKVLAYFLAQYFASFLASALVYLVYVDGLTSFAGDSRLIDGLNATAEIFSTFPTEGISQGIGFLDQVVGTFLLLFCIRSIIDKNNLNIPKHLQPILFGLLVLNIGISFGYNCANAVNPARDFGPRLFMLTAGYGEDVFRSHSYWFYVPVIAPHIGGILGSFFYDLAINFKLTKQQQGFYEVNVPLENVR